MDIGVPNPRNIHGMEGATLAALADLSEPRLADAQALYPALKTTTNIGDLFTDPAIDAVVVATPAGRIMRSRRKPSFMASMCSLRNRWR